MQAARNNDRMCTRNVSARREPDITTASMAAGAAPAALRPAVPFAQIEYNGGRNNPLWDYYRDLKEGPLLHKWYASTNVTCGTYCFSNLRMPAGLNTKALTRSAVCCAPQVELLRAIPQVSIRAGDCLPVSPLCGGWTL